MERNLCDLFCVAKQVWQDGERRVKIDHLYQREGCEIPNLVDFLFTDIKGPDQLDEHAQYAFTCTTASGDRYNFLCRRYKSVEYAIGASVIQRPLHGALLTFIRQIISTKTTHTVKPSLDAFIRLVAAKRVVRNRPIQIPFENMLFEASADAVNSLPVSDDVSSLFTLIKSNHLTRLISALLHEHRVIFTCKNLDKLTAVTVAARALLGPHRWYGLFIPLLPASLSEYVMAPTPYIIGIQEWFLATLPIEATHGAVLVNLDHCTVRPVGLALTTLPPVIAKPLVKLDATATVDSLRRVHCMLLRNTQAHISVEGGRVRFNKAAYLKSRSSTSTRFLTIFTQTQLGAAWLQALEKGGDDAEPYLIEETSFGVVSSVFKSIRKLSFTPEKPGNAFISAMAGFPPLREVDIGQFKSFHMLHSVHTPEGVSGFMPTSDLAGPSPRLPPPPPPRDAMATPVINEKPDTLEDLLDLKPMPPPTRNVDVIAELADILGT